MSSQFLRWLFGKISSGVIAFVNMVTLANRDYPYDDFETATTTSTPANYAVGENNIPGDGSQRKRFVSKSTLILGTTDTYVIFNNPNNVVHMLLANTWYEFKRNIDRIYHYYVSAEGTIYIHCEGVLPQEARSPE